MSPGSSNPKSVASTFVHAGVPSSIAVTQSTSVGTPPVVLL